MAKAPKILTLSWRDENYGSVYGQIAFRCYGTADLSETGSRKVQRAYRRAGFKFHDGRACWMAERSHDRVTQLRNNLEALGYVTEHCGATPAFVGL